MVFTKNGFRKDGLTNNDLTAGVFTTDVNTTDGFTTDYFTTGGVTTDHFKTFFFTTDGLYNGYITTDIYNGYFEQFENVDDNKEDDDGEGSPRDWSRPSSPPLESRPRWSSRRVSRAERGAAEGLSRLRCTILS
jgi:hypothetical protein